MKSLLLSITVVLACLNLGLGLKCYFGEKDDIKEEDLKDKFELKDSFTAGLHTLNMTAIMQSVGLQGAGLQGVDLHGAGQQSGVLDQIFTHFAGKPLQSCMKIENGDNVARGGLPQKVKNECKEQGDSTVCFCDTDKCNTAHSSAALLPLLILPALITHFL